MLIRVEIDGVIRHYCADCADTVGPGLGKGSWVGKGTCCACGLVGGGKGRRVKVAERQGELAPITTLADEEQALEEARLVAALTGREED